MLLFIEECILLIIVYYATADLSIFPRIFARVSNAIVCYFNYNDVLQYKLI